MKYQLCPKCEGQGIVSKPPWIVGDIHTWTDSSASHICDVCNGAKVLLVPDDEQPNYDHNEAVKFSGEYDFKNEL